ncbi:MAG: bifunctional [glutamate--ammonia ligase]-adenylyl-L-tyrosine phosphorylase/[glutamate--ammonia-ligase] adenylyltransferase [Desulfobacteraceae bacterium]|nr:bifunctional [glutamate--ammonia ligase]-adenylyl-L-tyrosine phosphorylase/[glutamate--ammonia-ligase] adenylyltransferase [Desulfobacteraceae bacterium]
MNTAELALSPALAEEAAGKWTAFCQAAAAAGLRVPEGPELAVELQRVFAFSEFVAQNAARYPGLVVDLVASGDIQAPYVPGGYRGKLAEASGAVATEPGLAAALRKLRRREMLRIAWRDLAGRAGLAVTMAELSRLADACIAQALTRLYDWQCAECGAPLDARGLPQSLVVLGMGKLGAGELNFSSDIDLVFAFPAAGETRGGPEPMDNHAFFVRLARRLISVLGQPSADGPMYRVDLRLRPFGENGPLVMSFDAMEEYYQEQGREWERYAWIKARTVAGDVAAGARLLATLKPFVFRRYLDYGTIEAIRDMKRQITLEVRRKGLRDNIKLGPGGIREIEFFGQVFQLIRGGVLPALQARPIQQTLDTLAAEGLVPGAVCRELQAAYIFLRDTEHRLQMAADRQTHQLPREEPARLRLAVSMGFEDWPAFHTCLAGHMAVVHGHFSGLLKTDEPGSGGLRAGDSDGPELENLWRGLLEPQKAAAVLAARGFAEPRTVLELVVHLRQAVEGRVVSIEARRRLDRLMPRILEAVAAAGGSSQTLNRVIELIKAIETRSCYMALLLENPEALNHLVRLTAASPMVAAQLARHPLLLDELLDSRTLYTPPRRPELESELARRLRAIDPDDLEYQMEALRVFKQTHILRVAAADVTGELPLMRVSDHLTDIAETVLAAVLDISWRHLVAKHGRPSVFTLAGEVDRGFAVVAYGKLGGIELGYGSDLDLVFLHAGGAGQSLGERPLDNAQFYARLGQRVIHLLTAHTAVGTLYEADMRLRPSGDAGILVSHVDGFEAYQLNDAWTWEHQALIRARVVGGDAALARRFAAIRAAVLCRKRAAEALRAEVGGMRQRMRRSLWKPVKGEFDLKQAPGGMVDIEFLVQYLILLEAHAHPELIGWTDNVRQLRTLMEAGVLDEDSAYFLKETYLVYRAAAHRLSLLALPARVAADLFARRQVKVREIWKQFMQESA